MEEVTLGHGGKSTGKSTGTVDRKGHNDERQILYKKKAKQIKRHMNEREVMN